MPEFSQKSRERLGTCHSDLQGLFIAVAETYDCTVIEGHRSNERQDSLFAEGKSKLRGGQSTHNSRPSMGVDVAPYPIDWKDSRRFYHFAGFVEGVASGLGLKIRWGGDWDSDKDFNDQNFNDLVHFELL